MEGFAAHWGAVEERRKRPIHAFLVVGGGKVGSEGETAATGQPGPLKRKGQRCRWPLPSFTVIGVPACTVLLVIPHDLPRIQVRIERTVANNSC